MTSRPLDGLYVGQIKDVLPPNHVRNTNKHQYEYVVIITADDYSQMPVSCIRNDSFGTRHDYHDYILSAGDKVFVMFPRGDRSMGVIFGGSRYSIYDQKPDLGRYWKRRFNEIEAYIDKKGNYSVTSDSGPHLHVRTNNIELNDSVGEEIHLDKDTKTLTLKTKEWVVLVTGNAKIVIDKDASVEIKGNANVKVHKDANVEVVGNTTLKTKSLTATVQETAKVSCKELSATASGNASLKASGNVTVDGAKISLNGSGGQILTTTTDPVIDLIFGVPTTGVPTVTSG